MGCSLLRLSLSLFLGLLILTGCAGLNPAMDPPKINLVSIRSSPTEEGPPRFEIILRVINPNEQRLDIAGISYSVELLDKELITGVANNISPIQGYGEGIVTLNADLQWLEVLRLMTSLGTKHAEPLAYRFSAKIDFYGLMPTQRLEDSGEITLN